MKLFLLSSVLLFIAHGHASSSDCKKGSEYWCQSLATAVDCSAVRYCQRSVWLGKTEKSRSLPSNNDMKIFCNDLAAATKTLINQGLTNTQSIKTSLKNECNKLTDVSYVLPYCRSAVNVYADAILRHIQNGVETANICQYIINADPLKIPDVENSEIISLKSAECTFCKFLIGYIDSQIQNNRTPAAVEAVLEKVCDILPATLKDNCTNLVTKYGRIIAFLLATNATPVQVCDFIKICNNGTELITKNTNNYFPMKYTSFSISQCSICKFLMNYAESVVEIIPDPSVSKKLLGNACQILPGPIADKCNRLANSFADSLFANMNKQSQDALDCMNLKLC